MSFNLPPLSKEEKEKKAEAFINSAGDVRVVETEANSRVLQKEKTKPMLIRFPFSMLEDIKEIAALTGISMNSICLELLRPAIKTKLKELKE